MRNIKQKLINKKRYRQKGYVLKIQKRILIKIIGKILTLMYKEIDKTPFKKLTNI